MTTCHKITTLLVIAILLIASGFSGTEARFGVNWGMITSRRLNAQAGVALIKSYGFQMVKFFGPYAEALHELTNHPDLEVMAACENGLLSKLAEDSSSAHDWVEEHIVPFVNAGANIKYVAIGNEPFLREHGDTFIPFVLPAMVNIYKALRAFQLEDKVRLTTPLNGDVLWGNLPSEGQFRRDIKVLMRTLIEILETIGGAFTINLYPFIATYQDGGFPLEYAFPGGNYNLVDGSKVYHNAFEPQVDLLLSSFAREGLGLNLPIIVGEIGWPTAGFKEDNVENARRFNQGLIDFVQSGVGTPLCPNLSLDIYLFGLVDEDLKSTLPGWFEPYWGLADAYGVPKYPLKIQA